MTNTSLKWTCIHPTRERVERGIEAVQIWTKAAAHPESVHYYLCVDDDDPCFAGYQDAFLKDDPILNTLGKKTIVSVKNRGASIVDAVNQGAAASSEPYLIVPTDDFYPCQNWDTVLSERIEQFLEGKNHRQAVVHINDNTFVNSYFTMQIVTREYYDHWGYMLYPEYLTQQADNDFTETARRYNHITQSVIEAMDINFAHQSPDFVDKFERDAVFSRNKETQPQGTEVWFRRCAINFGFPMNIVPW